MAKFYAPNFSGLLPLFDGQSAAGGKLYAYRAGSSIPAPLFNEDGVELGSWVSIDSNGCADFLLDSSLSYKLVAKDALGATVGEWDNVQATNAPGGMDNPMQNPGDLIVGGTGGTAQALPAGEDGQMLTPHTENGVKTLRYQNIPAQTGDHKVSVDGTDSAPGYLLDKLVDGDNAHFSKSGNTIVLDTDNDAVATDNQDEAPGFLIDKLEAGDNVAIEAVEVNGVRKAKISATGGGGGGGSEDILDWSLGSSVMCYNYSQPAQSYTYFQAFLTARKGTPKGIFIAGMNGYSWANTTVRVGLYNYDFNAAGTQLCYGQLSSTANPSGDVLFVPFTSTQEIVMGKRLWLAFCLTVRGNIRIPYVQVNENSFNRFKTTAITSGDTLSVAGSNGTIQGYECGVYY